MFENINEEVSVVVRFINGKIVPVILIRKSEKIPLKTLDFIHSSMEGNAKLLHFAVSNDATNYKLTYNTKSLIWTLHEIYKQIVPVNKAHSA